MKKAILAALLIACGGTEDELDEYAEACRQTALYFEGEWQQEVTWDVCEIDGDRQCVCVTTNAGMEPCDWALANVAPN